MSHLRANIIIENALHEKIDKIGSLLESDVISLFSPINYGIDDIVKENVEFIESKKKKLCVILETEGGVIQAAERMANVFRFHYPKHVTFIVPNFAMSAGTVLVMCGDEIFMNYYSVLGPIDPQVKKGERYVPALGYLEQFDRLKDRSTKGLLTTAEIILLEKLDAAELYQFEEARELSVSLLIEWLVKYKFKDWNKTSTSNNDVTPEMRRSRAEEIARKLSDTKKWHSHGRGISREILENDVNIQISDFGINRELSEAINSYTKLLQDYMGKRGHSIACHVRKRYVGMGNRI